MNTVDKMKADVRKAVAAAEKRSGPMGRAGTNRLAPSATCGAGSEARASLCFFAGGSGPWGQPNVGGAGSQNDVPLFRQAL